MWTGKPWSKIFIFWPGHSWQEMSQQIQDTRDGIFIIIGWDVTDQEQYPMLDSWLKSHNISSNVFLLNEDFITPLDITKNLECIIPLGICVNTLSNISVLQNLQYKIENNFIIDSTHSNSKKWLCLNRVLRSHRKYAKQQWIDRYPDYFVHSFGEEKFFGDINFYESTPNVSPFVLNGVNLFTLKEQYSTTCGSIVMETCSITPVTEKVFHALLALHPVIIVGNPGTVEYLRNQGFDMFDDFINHSYDNVTDINSRIDKLFTDNLDLISHGFDRQSIYQRLQANRDQVWTYYQNQLNNFEINLVKNLKHV
jgi:hypothetical protein